MMPRLIWFGWYIRRWFVIVPSKVIRAAIIPKASAPIMAISTVHFLKSDCDMNSVRSSPFEGFENDPFTFWHG